MNTLADRFRRWYEYERDCNAKTLAMIQSVPPEKRGEPGFARAVGRLAHLVAGRERWLYRLGRWPVHADPFPPHTLEELPALLAAIESAWTAYLDKLDDAELARAIEWNWPEGRYRWNVEGALTTLFGHAPYHRGQIAQLVAELGGKAVDTDYVFWSEPIRVGEAK